MRDLNKKKQKRTLRWMNSSGISNNQAVPDPNDAIHKGDTAERFRRIHVRISINFSIPGKPTLALGDRPG